MKLTANMRAALERANREDGLRRTFDGKPGAPPWPAPAVTLHALVRRGYLEVGERRNRKGQPMRTWTLTDAGREALNPPTRPARDVHHPMLAKGAARSLVMVGGQWQEVRMPEPEKVDPVSLHHRWDREAQDRHDRARGKLNGPPGRRAA